MHRNLLHSYTLTTKDQKEKLRKHSHLPLYQKEQELQDGGRVRRGDHLPPHRYIRNTSTKWNCSYRTPTERWQKTSDLAKGKKLPHVPG